MEISLVLLACLTGGFGGGMPPLFIRRAGRGAGSHATAKKAGPCGPAFVQR
jgi:hypothetical protein